MQTPSSPHSPAPPVIVAAPKLFIKRRDAHPSNYSRQKVRTRTQAIVLHATDGHEGLSKAEDVSAMFARPLSEPRSCTFVVDTDSVVQCVPVQLVAWHCGHTGNATTEGVELCGLAKQSREDWLDELSLPMLCLAARLVAERCAMYGIPPVFVDAFGLRNRYRGITTHAEVSKAWNESNHTDPGKYFPLAEFIAAVAAVKL